MVTKLPSILEVASYTFYCNTAALGVFFEFKDYKKFIEKTDEYENIPNPILPSLKLLAQVLMFMIIFVVGNRYVPL